MSRSDQYIGLTKRAEDYLDFIRDNYTCDVEKFELVPPEGTLACAYPIEGNLVRMYYNHNIISDVNEYFEFREEIQYEPWSSGPMYFTRLRGFLKKKNEQIINMGTYFDWTFIPNFAFEDVKKEFDYEKGEIYI